MNRFVNHVFAVLVAAVLTVGMICVAGTVPPAQATGSTALAASLIA